MEGRADWAKKRLQAELLDDHLEVHVLIVPEREGREPAVGRVDVVYDSGGAGLRSVFIENFEIVEGTGAILRNDVHRKQAATPTLGYDLLRGVEIALAEPMLFEQVTPVSGPDPKIDFEDEVAKAPSF
jgi:hypothetical protein